MGEKQVNKSDICMSEVAKKKHRKVSRRWFAGWALLLGCLLLTIHAWAEPSIARAFAHPGDPVVWYVNDVEGDWPNDGEAIASATVANVPCEVVLNDIRSIDDIHYRTIIMLDNSLSISSANREKAKALINSVIQNHVEGENFLIYTFEKNLTEIGSGSNYSSLMDAVEHIEFHDQDAYLIDCVAEVLQMVGQNTEYDYDRIILISDGVDDNKLGYTYDELLAMLDEDSYRCPIYTVASIWEKDTSGLKNLQALSRKVGCETFVLDDTENTTDVAEELRGDYDAKCFLIYPPLSEKDGTTKQIDLTFRTTQGRYSLSRAVKLPQLTQEEAEALAQEQITEEITEVMTEPHTDMPQTETEIKKMEIVVDEVAEVDTEADDMEEGETDQSFFAQYGLFMIAGAAVLIALIIVVLILVTRKKKKKMWDDDAYFDSMQSMKGSFDPVAELKEEKTQIDEAIFGRHEMTQDEFGLAGSDPHSGTVGMWDSMTSDNSGKMIMLRDLSNPQKRYEARLKDEIIIGRDSLCSIVIADDKTVSGTHCKLTLLDGDVLVEDLQSHNGTSVNGQKLIGGARLQTGDELKMGKTRVRVEIQ